MQSLKKSDRKGALGALMDEYERAASELGRWVRRISEGDFLRVGDPRTEDDTCPAARP